MQNGLLTYDEANLFVRFGEDMRFDEWPASDFIRMATAEIPSPEGYQKTPYVPTNQEIQQSKWRRA